jgi:DNA-binding response OmpR family regulator
MERKRRILVVDDSDSSRFTFSCLLEDAGFEVVQAWSLSSARSRLAEGNLAVAILDLRLPDGRGTELTREIRAACPNAAVVLLSGEHCDDAEGADLQLIKGELPADVLKRIAALADARPQ